MASAVERRPLLLPHRIAGGRTWNRPAGALAEQSILSSVGGISRHRPRSRGHPHASALRCWPPTLPVADLGHRSGWVCGSERLENHLLSKLRAPQPAERSPFLRWFSLRSLEICLLGCIPPADFRDQIGLERAAEIVGRLEAPIGARRRIVHVRRPRVDDALALVIDAVGDGGAGKRL